jgi:hypothetical protein
MQYDDGITQDPATKQVLTVNGKPLDPSRTYRIATKISDLTNGQSPPFQKYFLAHPELLPSKGDYINIQSELMGFFARNLWRQLWRATGDALSVSEAWCENDDCHDDDDDYDYESVPQGSPVTVSSSSSYYFGGNNSSSTTAAESRLRLSKLDRDGDGYLTVDDIRAALAEHLGLSIHPQEATLAEYIHSYADATGTGAVTVEDFELFCNGLPNDCKPLPSWVDAAFPEPNHLDDDLSDDDDDDDNNDDGNNHGPEPMSSGKHYMHRSETLATELTENSW